MIGAVTGADVSEAYDLIVLVFAALRRILQADWEALLRYLVADLAILETAPIMNRVLIVMATVEGLETLAMMLVSPLEDQATLETFAMMNPATIIFRLHL